KKEEPKEKLKEENKDFKDSSIDEKTKGNSEDEKQKPSPQKMDCKNLSLPKGTEKFFHPETGLKDSFSQDCKNLSPNDTDSNDTEVIYNQSISQSIDSYSIKGNKKNKIDRQIDISNHIQENYENTIKSCEIQAIDKKYRNAVTQAIRLLYLDIESKRRVTIGGNIISVEMMEKDLEQLNYFVVEHAVNKFKDASREREIKNKI